MDKKELIEKVLNKIESNGFKAYFVGGCVRDSILGKTPHDYDITTSATPEDLHRIFSKFSNVSNNSEKFGVTMPLIESDSGEVEEIEIATFRKDTSTGRKPSVDIKNVTLYEDAIRRDFTINALYEDASGKIFDPTGKGLADINAERLRFCGNAQDRIDEDPLRVLRLVRFVSKLGFDFVEN